MENFRVEYQMDSGKLYVSEVLKAQSKEHLEKRIQEKLSYSTVVLVQGYHLIVAKIESFQVFRT